MAFFSQQSTGRTLHFLQVRRRWRPTRSTVLSALAGLWVGCCVGLGLFLLVASIARSPAEYSVIQANPAGGGWTARRVP